MFWPFRKKKKQVAPDTAWISRYSDNAAIFKRYNEQRIEYIRSQLPERKLHIFDLVPALLHESAPGLIGNESGADGMAGIACFSLSLRQKSLLSKFFPNAKPSPAARPSLPIVFLAVMGSAGTIAFTGESDIDVWVGIEEEKHTPDRRDQFRRKLNDIEQWALAQSGLEIHFFISDIARIRREDYGSTEGESCGSALGKLLKDEFYRTAILLAGKIPFYWVIPAGTDDITYNEIVEKLRGENAFPHSYYVDIGPISIIYPEEYNGAALWQILKGLYSPFKSVLKIALLEKYAVEGGAEPPLCEVYKAAIFKSGLGPYLDPYLFMVESVRAYYRRQNMETLRRLIEKCFLIRSLLTAGEGLASGGQSLARIQEMGRAWGYTPDEIKDITLFKEWDYARNEALRKQIMAYYMDTYKLIRSRTPAAADHISQSDFTIIGKKLHVFFTQKPGKIPFEFSLLQARYISGIVIEEEAQPQSPSLWNIKILIKGLKFEHLQTLRKCEHPVAAFAYCSINRLYVPGQNFMLKGRLKLTKNDALHFIESIQSFFPTTEIDTLSAGHMLSEPRINRLYLWPNWNRPEWNYGIASVLAFTQNTHGEVFYFGFQGETYLKWLATLLLNNIGKEHLPGLQTAVHRPKEKLISRLKISDLLESNLKSLMEKLIV